MVKFLLKIFKILERIQLQVAWTKETAQNIEMKTIQKGGDSFNP